MKRYEGMMIASDLDGTFLNARGEIVRRNIEAIREFTAGGGLFTFATGRHHDHLPEAVPGVEGLINLPAIVANGSYLYDFRSGRVLAEIFMDYEPAREVLQFARAHYARVGFRVSTPRGFLTDGRTDYMCRFIEYSAAYRSYLVEVAPIECWSQRLWYKIVFRGEPEELDALCEELKIAFGDRFEYSKSSPILLELQDKGCHKGKMLSVLKESYERLLGRPIRTFGVGDYENDLPLLQAADVAACPANAIESVKKESDRLLCHCDDGALAELIATL